MRVLLAAEHATELAVLQDGLREAGYDSVMMKSSERMVTEMRDAQAQCLVVETGVPSSSLLSQLRTLNDHHPCPIVMFTRCADTMISRDSLKAGVSAYIVNGLQKERVKPIMDVAIERFNKIQGLQAELKKVSTNLEERKHIERAKGILMRRAHLQEETAYQTLRKMAMDRNKRIADVAETIISAEEFLVHG